MNEGNYLLFKGEVTFLCLQVKVILAVTNKAQKKILRLQQDSNHDLRDTGVSYEASLEAGHGSWVRIPSGPQNFFWALFLTA